MQLYTIRQGVGGLAEQPQPALGDKADEALNQPKHHLSDKTE